MGANHAREWTSFEVPMESLKQYLEGYGKDERLTKLVNGREVWFVPMVNPDGVAFSQNKTRYWRKNRRNVDGRAFGVDLNRNYGYKWGNVGASSSPTSDTYHGTGPFSEPETTAIKELAEKEKFQASVSFHSYSELNLYPFGYGYNIPCDDTPVLKKLANEMSQFNKYTSKNSAELYPAMGDSDDWLYGANKTLAFTVELGREFIPPATEIAEQNRRNVPAVLHLIDKAGVYAVNTPSGDPELAKSVELETGLDALVAGNEMLPEFSGESKMMVQENINRVSERVAELVAQDLLTGNTDSWQRVKAMDNVKKVQDRVRERVSFSVVHGTFVAPQILAELVKSR
jgi:hypothetical protein